MKKLKENRIASFLVIFFVYVLAAVLGVLIYKAIKLDWWLSLLVADAASTVLVFVFSNVFNNASVYDPYWSVQPPLILLAFAMGKELTTLGILLILVVFFWAVRLTANWAYTFKNLTHQDWRYTMLKKKTGRFYPIINFVGIHFVPTLVVYGCILPAVYAIRNGICANIGSYIFLSVSLLATFMQGIADVERHKFRKNRTSPFIRVGLWKYSRHPNYLGEILMWWGVGLAVVCAAPEVWYLSVGALANTALFFFVSIPMADRRQSLKGGFLEYKRQTRMLLPIKKQFR